MADEFDLDTFDDGSEGFKSLRKALKKYQTENETLKSENSELRQEKAKGQLSSAFAKHGVDPKFLPLYTDEDRSDEAIGRWAELYGFAKAPEESGGDAGSTVPTDEQKAQAAISAVGAAPGSGEISLGDRIKSAKNPAELNALLAERRASARG